jgi:hypothetical protein
MMPGTPFQLSSTVISPVFDQFWLNGRVWTTLSARDAPDGRVARTTAAAARAREARARSRGDEEDMRPPERRWYAVAKGARKPK